MEYFMTHEGYESITSLYSQIFRNTRNGFFQGLPCIMIGMAIAQHGVIRSNRLLIGILLLSLAAFIANIGIAKFINTYAILSLVLCNNSHKCQDNFYKDLRLASTVIYFTHMLFVGSMAILWQNLPPIRQFIVAIIGCFVLSIVFMSNKDTYLHRNLFS